MLTCFRMAIAAVILFLLATLAPGAEPFLDKTDLFEAGKDGYALYRIPGIVVTTCGTILAYCEARKSDRGDWGTIDILLRRSTDGGKTWEPRQHIAHHGAKVPKNPVALKQKLATDQEQTVNNPVAIVDRKTGVIQFLYCVEYARCFSMHSDDDGKTFSKPVDITAAFEKFRPDYDWKVLATGPGHGIQMTTGRMVVPVWLSTGTGGHAHRPSVASVIFSDDRGKTWQRGEIAVHNTEQFVNPSETVLVQLADGSVMLNVRNESATHRRLVTVSKDGATGWSKPEFHDQLLEPICMASMVRLSAKPASDRNRILFANPHNLGRADGKEKPGTNRDRRNLAVKLSDDEGKTWPVHKVLEPGPSAYSDLAVGADGTIYCFYERGTEKDKRVSSYTQLTLARFNVEWLTSDGLERLKHNHPGLSVDLGVGLWAWPLPMDFNGDGKLDLVVNCPDKPYNGVYVFENPGGKFPAFKPGRRISRGLQNVQVSFVDGKPRVLSPGMAYPDFLQTGLEKGAKLPLAANIHPNKVRANMWRYVDFDGDGQLDLIVGVGDWTEYGWDNAYDASGKWTNGPLRGFVYLVRNTGTTEKPVHAKPVKLMAGDQPVETFGWPSPNCADFDGDGDLDLLCGEFLDGFTYFENTGTRTQPRYAPGRRLKTPDGKPLVMDLQMITPTAIDWDGDGDLDLVVGDEDGRVALVEHTGKLANGMPQFLAPRYFQQEADAVKFGALATPVGFDWDGDGDQDIVCGNTAGYIGFIENLSGPGVERPRWARPSYLEADGKVIRIQAGSNGSIQGPCEAKWGYTTLSVADWDGDGLPDLVVNSIWGKVHWYRNTGTRKAPKLAGAQPIEVEWAGKQPVLAWGWLRPEGKALLTQWRTTPVAVDWNRDGLVDLVMLDHEGYLAFFERTRRDSKLLLLPPQRVLCDEQGQPLRLNGGTAGKSGRRKLWIVDWDGDGKLDVLVNSANAQWLRQVGSKDGRWSFRDMGNIDTRNIEGHDTSPTPVDWNNDGVPDLLIGAEDGHFYYLRNRR